MKNRVFKDLPYLTIQVGIVLAWPYLFGREATWGDVIILAIVGVVCRKMAESIVESFG